MNRMKPRPSQPPAKGKSDLLLRLFDSQFFDAWLALTYIYQKENKGVRDYLCNKLYDLPEQDIERYLSQFCQLIVMRPGEALERVIVDLCARSLRIAVKVFWLFKAISQDQPKNKEAADMLDRCEKAALNGYWDLPFKDPTLDPLSPKSDALPSPLTNAVTPEQEATGSMDGSEGSPSFQNTPNLHNTSSTDMSRPFSPVMGTSASLCSSHDMGQGLEGLIGASPALIKALPADLHLDLERTGSQELSVDTERSSSAHFERCRMLRQELGEGEGVSALLERSSRNAAQGGSGCVACSEDEPPPPPSSPRLRQTTFGATLDFIDALCDASSGLVHIPQEMRQKALKRALMDINAEIDLCSQNSVAVWFPMGEKNQRVLRLVANDAVILNSREKAPFMLFIEVLETDTDDQQENETEQEGELSEEHYADSAHSLMSRTESHVQAGPGPGSRQASVFAAEGAKRRQNCLPLSVDEADSMEVTGGANFQLPPSNKGRSLSESSAWKGDEAGELGSRGSGGTPPPTPEYKAAPHRNSVKGALTQEAIAELKSVGVDPMSLRNSFTRKIDTAMASLRGDAPLVRVKLTVLRSDTDTEEIKIAGRQHSSDSEEKWFLAEGASAAAAALAEKGGGDGESTSKALAILCRLGLCRMTCTEMGLNEEWHRRQKKEDKLVAVGLEVLGGMNLRIPSPSKKSRRVPSHEAIEIVADKMKVNSIPPPLPPPFGGEVAQRAWSERSEASCYSVTAREPSVDDLRALKRQKQANSVYGQRWHQKMEAIKKQSPHGRRKGWALKCVIVKSGDDCRQELLSIQLIRTFQDIFVESKVPLWLRPYEVLVTSNRTALIEFIPDSLSIHTIKHRSPPGTSLSQHFFNKFRRGMPECKAAQRNFVESMAAYSIITYLLQLKDRHNGNLLVDDEGHLIHIDFGFMLSNSPGGVNFEAAPFKLTREYLEVMDSNSEGRASEMFDYFKVLCIQGFMACRKHADRIILLCDMMAKAGFPCFKTGDRAIKALRKRFHLNIPEEQCVQVVIGLISDSLDAWRTRQYDYYQRVLNGIL